VEAELSQAAGGARDWSGCSQGRASDPWFVGAVRSVDASAEISWIEGGIPFEVLFFVKVAGVAHSSAPHWTGAANVVRYGCSPAAPAPVRVGRGLQQQSARLAQAI